MDFGRFSLEVVRKIREASDEQKAAEVFKTACKVVETITIARGIIRDHKHDPDSTFAVLSLQHTIASLFDALEISEVARKEIYPEQKRKK
jgi:hypothetical protein